LTQEDLKYLEDNILNIINENNVVNEYPYLNLIMSQRDHHKVSNITAEIIEKAIIDHKDNLLQAARITLPVVLTLIKLSTNHTVMQRSDIRVALKVIESIRPQIIDNDTHTINIEMLVRYVIQYNKKITIINGIAESRMRDQSWRSLYSNFLALLFVIISDRCEHEEKTIEDFIQSI